MASPTPLTVMVPLGGIGSRFQKEGYASPKPFINVLGKPMLMWVLDSLRLEPCDELVVVYDPKFLPTKYFEATTAKYPRMRLVELPGPTRGAAETVLAGLRGLPDEAVRSRPVMLVDGDSFYGEDIVGKYREHCATNNGVFYFKDAQPEPMYSYIQFDDGDMLIREVKEKVKISDNANSGCYCFRDGDELMEQCQALLDAGDTQLSQDRVGEYYTSGVIAAMIELGRPFRAIEIRRDQFHVLGTPAQVEEFCRRRRDHGKEEDRPPQQQQGRRRVCFQLEGTLVAAAAAGGGGGGGDGDHRPIAENVAACRELYGQGHDIVISSSRPKDEREATEKMLADLDIPYHELVSDEIRADFYVDTRALCPFRDIHKEIGFYAGSVACTGAEENGGRAD